MIYIENEQSDIELSDTNIKTVESSLRRAVEMQLGKVEPEISLIFVSEEEIQTLNRENRGIDKITDVLSFPANDLLEPATDEKLLEHEGDSVLLGDIAICVKRAKEQAEEYGNTLMEEICFLAVHGCLHIMGYDHMTEEQEKEMRLAQRKALGRKEDESLD